MADFFTNNIVIVFFFYGLAFFSMGLAVLLEIGHTSELDFAQALRPLAGFGLVHGCHEWLEMGLIIQTRLTGEVEPDWVFYIRLFLLASSFIMLIAFGVRLILGPRKTHQYWIILGLVTLLWCLGLLLIFNGSQPIRIQLIAADVYTRYALAIPGAALTCWGLILQGRTLSKAGMKNYAWDVWIAAGAFAMYGAIGQLFASPSILFPSVYINSEVFLRWIGFPIQGFRALAAIIAAIFIIRSLRAFDEENRRRIQALSDAQRAEQNRLQSLRAELLHRTVQAQEQERQRIARDLHDETGQTLTALGMGLNGITQTIPNNPQRAIQQARHLQTLAANGLTDLQRLVSGLHPPQLDELGLLPTLRWYAQEVNQYYQLPVTISGSLPEEDISPEAGLTVFRIVQEAVTNTIRHAQASKVTIDLESTSSQLCVRVQDDGQGFDVEAAMRGNELSSLGLLGMLERASLIDADCQIESRRGKGTIVEVKLDRGEKSKKPNPASTG
jgi:signal transduction histidine kinase